MLKRGFNVKDPIAKAFGKIAGNANNAAKKFSSKAEGGACKVCGVSGKKKLKR